ncbi:nuclear transport factor 2 family protein [Amycolatopsis sp. 195334CR]|uniref:nuclear transport factor 2 family protein n=1 Tax=Amycolatopsis sp. 195334CR TaxID=2814588 RepID=UPI001A8F44F4|nr:nuclear transport factor 2 family protein [Amycolatopsis sp. 195334CR]MBN6037353.1 nuclear transport factor 2 family protein [Amycolatopsis sp. 195334CR]
MSITVSWDTEAEQPPARLAAWRSMNAVVRGAKEEWLDLFAADATVEDPVGPSFFDEEGKGHHGREGISAFWDKTIGQVERFEFTIRDSHAAGDEVANVGTITTYLPGNYRVDTDGVFVYRVGEDGLIRSMRAFWETERAMATAREVKD